MLKKLLYRMAGMSSLYNIRCSIDDLDRFFPDSPDRISKEFFNLVMNISSARDNGVSSEVIRETILKKCDGHTTEIRHIATEAQKIMEEALEGRQDKADALEAELNRFLVDRGGAPLDATQMPLVMRAMSLIHVKADKMAAIATTPQVNLQNDSLDRLE